MTSCKTTNQHIMFKKKSGPSSPKPSKQQASAIRTNHNSGSQSSTTAAGADTPSGGDASLLSELSPTSYAKQFDDLDQMVALATHTPKSQGGGKGGGRGKFLFNKDKKLAAADGGGGVDKLSKNMDGLSLGSNHNNTADVLDFDDEPDDVFEDDDDAAGDTGDDSHGGGGGRSHSSGKKKSWTSSALLKKQAGRGTTPKKNGPSPGRSTGDRSRSNQRDRRRGGMDHAASRSVSAAKTDDGRGEGGMTSVSSSSSSMGDAYDNASVGTTESEGDSGGSGKGKGGHGSDSAEDYTDDEDEGEDGYKVGGYHRVKVGEIYNQR